VEVVDDGDLAEQSSKSAVDQRLCRDDVDRVPGSARQRGPRLARVLRAAHEHARSAEILRLEMGESAQCGVQIGDRHRVRSRAERRRDRCLVARFDGDQRGDRAEQAFDGLRRGEKMARSALSLQSGLQRVEPGGEGRTLLRRLPLLVPQRGQFLGGPSERRLGGFVLGVEADLAFVQPGDVRLQRLEGPRRVVRARQCGIASDRQARHLLGGILRTTPQRAHLTGQPGETLASIRRGPYEGGET